MLKRLNLPESTVLVFSKIFSSVTFDIIQTDKVYPLFLTFNSDSPFSEEAVSIGYNSRYFIPNSGSITIYIAATILIQIF